MTNIMIDDVYIPDNLHVFIVEDTAVFQRKLQEDLKTIGFRGKVTLTATVKDALVNIVKEKPDLILSDWNLPDGFGIEFLKMVRSDEAFSKLPFVMITTIDEIDNILEAVESDVDGYIVKPWSIKELKEKIGFAYNKRSRISLNF